MPREPPATSLCLSMIVGAGQGRNFSLEFSSYITLDRVQLQSLDQHSLGTRREHVDCSLVLVDLQAQECRANNLCIFPLASLEHAGCSWNGREKRAEPVWEERLVAMEKALKEAAAECLGYVLEGPSAGGANRFPQVVLSCTARLPLGVNCLPHCVVLKDRSPSFAFQSV